MFYANQVWGRPITWPKFYRLKVGRKRTSLNRYISVNTDIDEKWFVILEHTINWLCFGYANFSFTPTWILFFFFFTFFLLFFLFFIILLRLFTFKPLNALYSKFEWLKISGRTSLQLKLGMPGWGNPPQTCPSKFWTFKPLKLDQLNLRNG